MHHFYSPGGAAWAYDLRMSKGYVEAEKTRELLEISRLKLWIGLLVEVP